MNRGKKVGFCLVWVFFYMYNEQNEGYEQAEQLQEQNRYVPVHLSIIDASCREQNRSVCWN